MTKHPDDRAETHTSQFKIILTRPVIFGVRTDKYQWTKGIYSRIKWILISARLAYDAKNRKENSLYFFHSEY